MTYHVDSGVDPSSFHQAISHSLRVMLLLILGVFSIRLTSQIQLPSIPKREMAAQTAAQTVPLKSTIPNTYSVADLSPCGCPSF